MVDEFRLKMPDFHVTFRDLLHASKTMTWDKGLYFPSEGRLVENFFALNPRTWVPKASDATSRPPKPLVQHVTVLNTVVNCNTMESIIVSYYNVVIL